MSQLTLGGVIDYVRDYVPQCPQAKIVRKLNLILEEIHEEVAQIEQTTVTTRAKVTTGTVMAALGSTAVTFSSAVLTFPNTDSLVLVQIAGSSTWYVVTPSSTTVAALSSAFDGASGPTLTYTIVYPVVVFPASVGQILNMNYRGDALMQADKENHELRLASFGVGRPRWYGSYVPDTTATPDDAHRVILTPYPDAVYSLECSSKRRPVLLGIADATTTKLVLPSLFNRAIQFGTLALCWSQEDGGARFGEWWGRYKEALREARATVATEDRGHRTGFGRRRGRNWDYYERTPGT